MNHTHRTKRRWLRTVTAGAAGAALLGITAVGVAGAGEPTSGAGTAGSTAADSAPAAEGEVAEAALPDAGVRLSEAEKADVESYWTEERMAEAEPEEAPAPTAAELAAIDPPSNVLPRQKEAGTAPADASVAAEGVVTPLSVPVAERWGGQGDLPASSVGNLYFTRSDGGNGRCSAAVITAENRNTLWTAAHCIHEGPDSDYRTNIMFAPDSDNGEEPHGRWVASSYSVPSGWVDTREWTYDYAAIALEPHDTHGDIEDHVGAQGYDFGSSLEFDEIHALAYPGNGYQRDDFNGQELWYCAGPTTAYTETIIEFACDMRSGASGSPWLNDLDDETGIGHIVSAHSHSFYSDGEPTREYVYAAYHGDGAISLYEDVSTQ